MIRFFPKPIFSRQRMAVGFFIAVVLGGMVPAKAGLDIIAIAGDISTPSPNVFGGGNLTTIFNQAAFNWELAYPDPDQEWTVTLTYNWGALGADQVAKFTDPILDADGRIIAGTITFNNINTPLISWFADPNPDLILDNPNFTPAPIVTNQSFAVLDHEVRLNIGIRFAATAGSEAVGRSDLLTISMHEIGHGLGLLSVPDVYEPPHPLKIPEEVSAYYAGYEIFVSQSEHLSRPSLMESMTDLGFRFYPSGNDILAMATIAGYQNPVLNPLNIPGVVVPEPSSLALSLGALMGLQWWRRRKQSSSVSVG